MIGDTLRACLTGNQRRNHELYNHEKLGMLYSVVLADDDENAEGGVTDIERTIIEMNDRASKAVEEFEKNRNKKSSFGFQKKGSDISPEKRRSSDDNQSPLAKSGSPDMIASESNSNATML